MKNITISVDDETYRISCIIANENGTSLPAMMREYLINLTRNRASDLSFEELEKDQDELIDSILKKGGGLHPPKIFPATPCTTGMRFVDTNIPLYAVSSIQEEREKQRIAADLLRRRDLAMSAQVLGEFYVQATRPSRIGALRHEQAARFIRDLQRFYIQPVTQEMMTIALRYCQRSSLSYWDSLILAAAHTCGCDAVYSEDMSAQQEYDALLVINPFAEHQP